MTAENPADRELEAVALGFDSAQDRANYEIPDPMEVAVLLRSLHIRLRNTPPAPQIINSLYMIEEALARWGMRPAPGKQVTDTINSGGELSQPCLAPCRLHQQWRTEMTDTSVTRFISAYMSAVGEGHSGRTLNYAAITAGLAAVREPISPTLAAPDNRQPGPLPLPVETPLRIRIRDEIEDGVRGILKDRFPSLDPMDWRFEQAIREITFQAFYAFTRRSQPSENPANYRLEEAPRLSRVSRDVLDGVYDEESPKP